MEKRENKTPAKQIWYSQEYQKKNDRVNVVFPAGTRERMESLGVKSAAPFIKKAVAAELERLEKEKEKGECEMNETVKKAYEIARETGDFEVDYLPEVEVGEIVELNDVWDGEGEAPDNEESGSYGSYSHQITNDQWINYEFDIVEKKENPLDTLVKITKIELI